MTFQFKKNICVVAINNKAYISYYYYLENKNIHFNVFRKYRYFLIRKIHFFIIKDLLRKPTNSKCSLDVFFNLANHNWQQKFQHTYYKSNNLFKIWVILKLGYRIWLIIPKTFQFFLNSKSLLFQIN